MAELVFYGGVNEIGGNKILLVDKESKIMLDFGQSFTMGKDYFTDWLIPRRLYGLKDYFEFNVLPKIKGLYDQSQLSYTGLSYTKPEIDAIILSHAHFDHMAHISFTDKYIPIYCGSCSSFFIDSWEETTSLTYGEHIYHNFRTGDILKIGSVTLTPIHVDHSIPGAYGFIINTEKGNIVYTGDLRSHGPKKEMTEEFIRKARESEPVALITEGTRMVEDEKRKNYSEAQVKRESLDIVSKTDKIVFVTHYSRDTDRFRTMYEVAKANNRRIVIFPRTAYLLTQLLQDEYLELPNPSKDPNILVYYKGKKSGTFNEKDYYSWERGFMDKMVTSDYIRKNQSDLMMDLDLYQFGELIDIKPDPGSHFIHSMSEPFSEEDVEDKVMRNWLNHFQIKSHQLHASGHMNRQELTDMIDYIKPKSIFPIHTENPNLFKKRFKKTIIIEKEIKYKL